MNQNSQQSEPKDFKEFSTRIIDLFLSRNSYIHKLKVGVQHFLASQVVDSVLESDKPQNTVRKSTKRLLQCSQAI